MHASIPFLLLVFLFSFAAAYSCHFSADSPCYTAAENGACGYLSYNADTGRFGPQTYCPSNQYCNGTYVGTHIGTCLDLVKVGDSCPYSNCVEGALCNGSQICEEIKIAQTVGATCDGYHIVCAPHLLCNYTSGNYTCAVVPSVGETCDPAYYCGGNAWCNRNTLKCEPQFSVTDGGFCTETEQCSAGLFCAGYVDSKCHPAFTASGQACEYDDDCPNKYEICDCVSPNLNSTCVTPFVYSQENASAVGAMDDCMWNNNCSEIDCPACKTSACNYFIQQIAPYYNASYPCWFDEPVNNVYKTCDFQSTGLNTSSSASFLAASFFFLVLACFVAM